MTPDPQPTPAPPAEPEYSHEETERLINQMRLRPTNQTLADALAAQLAHADERVRELENELATYDHEEHLMFVTAERDRLRRENEELRKYCTAKQARFAVATALKGDEL